MYDGKGAGEIRLSLRSAYHIAQKLPFSCPLSCWHRQSLPASPLPPAQAQATLDDGPVLLHGFDWDSYRYGQPKRFPRYQPQAWYEVVKSKVPAIAAERFDLIWLPPPACAGGDSSAGKIPRTIQLVHQLRHGEAAK